MEFDWDDAKDAVTRKERGFGLDVAIALFDGPTIEYEDRRRDYGERRMIAHGRIDSRQFVAVYTDRERDGRFVRWIISLRKANEREVSRYHDQLDEKEGSP